MTVYRMTPTQLTLFRIGLSLHDRLALLQQQPCECETHGWCWVCQDIARLRSSLRGVAA